MTGVTRREALSVAAGLTFGGIATGVERSRRGVGRRRVVELGAQPAGLPDRQHAWGSYLRRDAYGNAVAPTHNRLIFLEVARTPTAEDARQVEAAFRALEREWTWAASGLLVVVGWAPRYFERWTGRRSPVPRAQALSDFEDPALDDYDCCVHLASDDPARLALAEAALVEGRPLPSGARGALGDVLRHRETRTGFSGAGLPAGHQDLAGIPPGRPVPHDAPLFMGFRSGLRRNQATEDDVTIAGGPLAGGTTMHVSSMRLRLDSWYGVLDERERVARMFGPGVTPERARSFRDDAPSGSRSLERDALRRGVIGHTQAAARARRDGRPLILRRAFDSADGGQAGVHFVSLQRSIDDFVRTRRAMNAAHATTLNPAITETVNNGINEFIFVTHRGNYAVPRRAARALPLAR